ncbi:MULTISPECIES: PEP-CTERM sorting domain-containing protein [unclassified Microcystis]|uniref:PEP-CTERM sorting domain-containing protein n=1 Tax=unclassified Microcystis TaxID=2643300 RepID=UPI0011950AC7|nr:MULTISPECIES: PEP-CTERM sorting domain-containing protein [unclassified Microcystis]MCA2926406.1 PEP-CTERM sorting domain-containing protein [Microcystis sp. M020S1]MCA2934673.1 PEP-CTERM sorting domain-containing protein [Microcystis sp. M015S1]MCA2621647.1 PEP-CTERM sorting domain-containing protein [Microcystis sp. M099S2]MCA2648647.1 PEP-CTERM sorting domain-containing protein [Microcystis sp. M065S2]MCA2679743.1 PEP-CTERM sorting domain-containing protein [Microcystis sp. M043S2]
MTNQLLKALCLPPVTCAVFSAIPAHAAIFTATYTDTVSANFGVDNVTAGDTAVITYQLDNGGTSLLGQTWTASNIVTVTFNFGNGSHVTTFNPNGGDGLSVSLGSFVTNASGQLTAVPSNWRDSSNLNVVSTNSTQTPRSWYVNGNNGVYYTFPINMVGLTNVSGNIVAANWTIQPAQTQTTPEPGTLLGLLAVGSLGALARKRQ